MFRVKVISALFAFALIGTGCAQLQQLEHLGNSSNGATIEALVEDSRIGGGWFLFPDATDNTMCNGLNPGFDIPCRDVLNVCIVQADGNRSTEFMPEVYRCTDASPTWRDVCLTRPSVEWDFYGYTAKECAQALP